MRDILITVLIFGALPLILWRPYIGVLVWSWLSYMNPHRQAWGFAYDMPFAQIVAITLLVSMLFNKERFRLPWGGFLVFWLIFLLWMTLTTFTAIYPDGAWLLYDKVIKVQVMTLVTMMVICNSDRLHSLICVIVASIGFYSLKGGIFTLASGGAYRVYGPAQSEITENNALALATLIVIPLMVYLYRLHREVKWLRYLLGTTIFFSVLSVVGSQSRGALIAIFAVGFFFWLKTSSKFVSAAAIVLLGALIFSFMPQSWHSRMNTISSYEEDSSAMSRIYAWKFAINVANDRFTGGGFNSWSKATYQRYSPGALGVFVAHSIYFSVLADHGWVGLTMYLILLFLAWKNLSRAIVYYRDNEDPYQLSFLARMLQVSLVAYLSGGAFLSLSYFDLPWHIIAFSLLLGRWTLPGVVDPTRESGTEVQAVNKTRFSRG